MSISNKTRSNYNSSFRISSSHPPRRYKPGPIPKIILSTIFIVIFIVVVAVISSFLLTPERRVKASIDSLASNYYENYIYKNLISSPKYSGDINGTMQKYIERGFAPVPLRQIISFSQTTESDSAKLIEEYCDINRTFVKFYPDAPFSSTAYHIDYTYSCEF